MSYLPERFLVVLGLLLLFHILHLLLHLDLHARTQTHKKRYYNQRVFELHTLLSYLSNAVVDDVCIQALALEHLHLVRLVVQQVVCLADGLEAGFATHFCFL